jgi:hypothetical protein
MDRGGITNLPLALIGNEPGTYTPSGIAGRAPAEQLEHDSLRSTYRCVTTVWLALKLIPPLVVNDCGL